MIELIAPVKLEPIPHITPSNASTIGQCAYQLIVRRSVKKNLLPPSANAEFGTAIHKALEQSAKRSFSNRLDVENFVDDILRQAENICLKRGYEFLTPFSNQVRNYGVKRELAVRKILSTSASAFTSYSKGSIGKPYNHVEVERDFVSKRFKIRGKIDTILHQPNGAVLVDFKTGSVYEEDENGERSLKVNYANQLKLYAYLYYEESGEFPIDAYVETFTGNTVHLNFTLKECFEYAQSLDEQLNNVNQLVQTNRIDALKPTNVDVCQWCSVRPACNLYQPDYERTGIVDLFGRLTAINKLISGNYSISLTNLNGITRVIGVLASDVEKLKTGYEYRFFNLRNTSFNKVNLLSFTTSSSLFEVTP